MIFIVDVTQTIEQREKFVLLRAQWTSMAGIFIGSSDYKYLSKNIMIDSISRGREVCFYCNKRIS